MNPGLTMQVSMVRKTKTVNKKVATTSAEFKDTKDKIDSEEKAAPVKKAIKVKPATVSATVAILDIIKKADTGVNVSFLREKTGND